VGIEAVIFDIGGVLEVTPPTGWQERWLGRLGVGREAWDRRLAPVFHGGSVGAMTLSQVEKSIAASFGLAETDLRSFMADLWSEYLGTLNRPLAEYFDDLRPRYRTGILSNSFVGARERERELYGFEEMCDAVVYSHEEGFLKPDGRVYRIACRRLGVEPARCVFVDDVQPCVDGALAVGMHAIRFTDNAQAIRELNHLLVDPRT
jgi:putative hydrolase of the HAD superfamily